MVRLLEIGYSLGFGASGTESLALPRRVELATVPDMRLEPANIQQIGDELAIQWNDGTESYLELDYLRRACPCAGCGGEPDVLGNISRPNVTYSDDSFELKSFALVGGYALQPQWADSHNTGIYSFQYLRRLAASVSSP